MKRKTFIATLMGGVAATLAGVAHASAKPVVLSDPPKFPFKGANVETAHGYRQMYIVRSNGNFEVGEECYIEMKGIEPKRGMLLLLEDYKTRLFVNWVLVSYTKPGIYTVCVSLHGRPGDAAADTRYIEAGRSVCPLTSTYHEFA